MHNKVLNKKICLLAEEYMRNHMKLDSSHDINHVYRVLFMAMDIVQSEVADAEIVYLAAVLHDVGRRYESEQNRSHAAIGADMAYEFLINSKYDRRRALWISECIRSHRQSDNVEPTTIEGKILFDADKLDFTGTMGISRALMSIGKMNMPLYCIMDKSTCAGGHFLEYYDSVLSRVSEKMYTDRAKEIAHMRKEIADVFVCELKNEINQCYKVEQTIERLFI
ncbi:HD domain-containing protein [Anaerocolumna sedimenticola]|uniref:HD domain-containing protein n=1 Tax=Anaerocolumna sedimenticola TaxID=2696063 RepID=A0A6P1TRZ3_9FIRM|nr:HD domain-containing protein [Anaerocolumna sedimenticola]QHQ62265.1 HD domain-containing protein [Anaerocolumna sedimenticola]